MSLRSSQLCLSCGRGMTLMVSTLQYLESSKGFWQQSVVVDSCCDAATGKCPIQSHGMSLNSEAVFDNLKHSGIVNRMVLSKVMLEQQVGVEIVLVTYTSNHIVDLLQWSHKIVLKLFTRAAAHNGTCQERLGCNMGHTTGYFVSYHVCHRHGVQRYRFNLQVWLRHHGINIPRYAMDTMQKNCDRNVVLQ